MHNVLYAARMGFATSRQKVEMDKDEQKRKYGMFIVELMEPDENGNMVATQKDKAKGYYRSLRVAAALLKTSKTSEAFARVHSVADPSYTDFVTWRRLGMK